MGQAKRRKELDPNFGKVELKIIESPNSNNFILACGKCGYWITSALKYEDILKCKIWFDKVLESDRPQRLTNDGWREWRPEILKQMPDFDAECLEVNRLRETQAVVIIPGCNIR